MDPQRKNRSYSQRKKGQALVLYEVPVWLLLRDQTSLLGELGGSNSIGWEGDFLYSLYSFMLLGKNALTFTMYI